MATLSRVTGKLFGGSAPLDEIGQFGSAKAGTKLNTQDVATIQALQAYSEGWGSAIISDKNFPPIEEVTGVLKTLSYQNCYLLQEGIPAYDINTTYSNTSIVKSITGNALKFFISLTDNNIGNPLSDTTHWAEADLSSGRNLGEIVTSTIPLSDSGLHLLDGALIQGTGSYADFVTYMASIYNSSLNYFCTESEWQTSVSTYGVCGKFVYNSTNNTIRLPKLTGFTEGTIDITKLGNLTQAGLPNITGTIPGENSNVPNWWSSVSGAFYQTSTGSTYGFNGPTDQDDYKVGFDASRSSAIYGRSNTVQPQSVKVLYYIVIATSQKTEIEVDIDEIATDLNGKADVDLSNVPTSKGILTQSYVNGESWYRVYSDGWIEQGFSFSFTGGEGQSNSVNLLKQYTNTNYTVIFNPNSSNHFTSLNRTVSSFSFLTYERTPGASVSGTAYVYICGY